MKRLLLFISVCCTFTSLSFIGLFLKKKYIYIIHRYARMCVLMYYVDKENKTRLSLSKLFSSSVVIYITYARSLAQIIHSENSTRCKQENSAENRLPVRF